MNQYGEKGNQFNSWGDPRDFIPHSKRDLLINNNQFHTKYVQNELIKMKKNMDFVCPNPPFCQKMTNHNFSANSRLDQHFFENHDQIDL